MGSKDSQIDPGIAVTPNDIAALPRLLSDVTDLVNGLVAHGEVDRRELLVKCRSMVQAIETPRETMVKHCWAQTGTFAAINFGVDCGLWKLMAQNGDRSQQGLLCLSVALLTSPFARLMRHLGAMGYLVETNKDEYKPTNFSKALSMPVIGNGYLAMLSCTSAGSMKFHEFSRERGWKNPEDGNDTSMMKAYGTSMNFFSWLQHQGYGHHFSDHMGGRRLGRIPWMNSKLYPVQQRLIQGADTDPGRAFLVDIGGGAGHDLIEFRQHYPDAPGKLILQDLPAVLKQVEDLDPAIVCMEYDFFEEQPVKGARAYYVHSILNNFPDDICGTILGRIKSAMKPGYSKLLINEIIMPETGANWEATALDMVMLTMFSSQERTMPAWRTLIERNGFSIAGIWSCDGSVQSVIECYLTTDLGR